MRENEKRRKRAFSCLFSTNAPRDPVLPQLLLKTAQKIAKKQLVEGPWWCTHPCTPLYTPPVPLGTPRSAVRRRCTGGYTVRGVRKGLVPPRGSKRVPWDLTFDSGTTRNRTNLTAGDMCRLTSARQIQWCNQGLLLLLDSGVSETLFLTLFCSKRSTEKRGPDTFEKRAKLVKTLLGEEWSRET